jgi:hypothetical protein
MTSTAMGTARPESGILVLRFRQLSPPPLDARPTILYHKWTYLNQAENISMLRFIHAYTWEKPCDGVGLKQ